MITMSEEKRYKIILQSTSGWNLIEDYATNLPKERCSQLLNQFIREGNNPNDLKAVLVNDPRYPD